MIIINLTRFHNNNINPLNVADHLYNTMIIAKQCNNNKSWSWDMVNEIFKLMFENIFHLIKSLCHYSALKWCVHEIKKFVETVSAITHSGILLWKSCVVCVDNCWLTTNNGMVPIVFSDITGNDTLICIFQYHIYHISLGMIPVYHLYRCTTALDIYVTIHVTVLLVDCRLESQSRQSPRQRFLICKYTWQGDLNLLGT